MDRQGDAATSETLDFRGLKCPLPALMARRALERARPGGEIRIVTDDPLAPVDIPHMCRQEGYECIAMEREGAVARMTLRRPGSSDGSASPPNGELRGVRRDRDTQ
jgi:tRNA 2-thiouridine synthesizing protein A